MVLLKTVLTFTINIPLLPSLLRIVLISGGSFQQMSSTNLSISEEIDSQNQLQLSGINILTPGPVLGQTPFVPQPMGSPTTAPISHLPPSPGQLPMGSPEFTPKVSQSSTSNEFQQLFYEARNIAEHTYFLIRYFFDVSQIKNLEEFYRIIDIQIGRITPFVSQQTENYNVYEMVKALRVIQTRIENTLISFYQNLEERDRMKIIFTLPQLRDHSFIGAVNRSVHYKVSQSINNSVNKSIFQSTNKSISPNSSLGKNSSNDFFMSECHPLIKRKLKFLILIPL